jgi:hypothetical protein
MNDADVLTSIQGLVDEEHTLLNAAEQGGLSSEDRERLDDVQVRLDQCWDLLRQRRALREFGGDPDRAHARDARTVEHYQQ